MELTIDQALQKAVEAHKAGQIQEADRFYTAIIKAQPKNPDANHNMGVLAVGAGKVEAALPFFKIALEANPKVAQFWLSYIDALIKLERFADAKAVLDQAKSKGAKGDGFNKLEQRLKVAGETPDASSETTAEAPPPQPNILDSLTLDQAIKLAQKNEEDGFLKDAQLIYQDVLSKFPKNKRAKDGLKDLEDSLNDTICKFQNPPEDQVKSLIDFYNLGQLQQAINQSNDLLKRYPRSALLCNIHGAVLKAMGQLDLSIEAYKKALAIKPDYAASWNNIGVVFQEQGKLEEAIEAYNKAIAIKPDYAEAYYNMANALQDQCRLENAIEAYKKAIAIKSDYSDAYNNMGVTLKDLGKLEEAIEAYGKAIAIKPDYAEAYYNIGRALAGVTFEKPNPDGNTIILSLLDKKSFVRPMDISRTTISLLKSEPKLKRHLKSYFEAQVELNLPVVIKDLTSLPLLLKFISISPLPDLELENLLRELRTSLLFYLVDLTGSAEELKLQSALALHCFTNEYIYNQSQKEDEALEALESAVEHAFSNNEQPSPQSILCLASYKPLNHYEWHNALLMNDEIEDVFIRQVVEPNQEAKYKSIIPVLEEITDGVSSNVRNQYEVSPYPRWVNLGLPWKPATIPEMVKKIKLKLFDDAITRVQSPKILIAGCGTGEHSIGTAMRFKGAKVLAIDLSLSSLSYAKRKTKELGIKNVEYMHADILDLGKLGRRFDIVESVGVLHHMADPVAGWSLLTDCLKPGGLMRIGLYSELARQHIVEMRQEINNAGIISCNEAMKSFRKTLIQSNQPSHKTILGSSDFYSMSGMKDLLFHVQEHRFSIPQIKDCLSDIGLKFCGFESDEIVSHFKLANASADDLYNLDKWHAYEEANPRVFAGMYQFWCQKIV